jgi:hypothetical protein
MKISHKVFISLTKIPSLSSFLFPSPSSSPSSHPPLSRQALQEDVSLVCVQGCNLSDSSVYPNSVLLRIHKQPIDSRLLEKDLSLRLLQNFLSASSHHRHRLSRIVLVQNVIPTPGTAQSSTGSGGSQSAEEVQNQISYLFDIHSSPPSTSSALQQIQAFHTQAQNQSYLDLFLSSLLKWRIQVVLCPEPIPLQVLDLCAEHHVILLPCNASCLAQLSGLLQLECVEDVVDLTKETVSDESKYELTVSLLDPVRVIDNEDGVQEGASLFAQQESTLFILTVSSHSAQLSSPAILNPITSYPAPFLPEYRPHTVVVIRAPSAISGAQLHDRIRRCLSRLSHLVCPSDDYCGLHLQHASSSHLASQLLCGGGLVELLCALECSELLNRAEIESRWTDEQHPTLVFVQSFQTVFEKFVRLINLNNGMTEETSLRLWEESRKTLTEALAVHSPRGRPGAMAGAAHQSITQLVFELPTQVKWKLVAPVDPAQVGDELHSCRQSEGKVLSPHPPLDIFSIKREMIQTALYAVRLILNTETIDQ